jgi:hypothetical protein
MTKVSFMINFSIEGTDSLNNTFLPLVSGHRTSTTTFLYLFNWLVFEAGIQSISKPEGLTDLIRLLNPGIIPVVSCTVATGA